MKELENILHRIVMINLVKGGYPVTQNKLFGCTII